MLGDAADYYAEHANPMIAQAFIAEFERVRDLWIENQGLWPHHFPWLADGFAALCAISAAGRVVAGWKAFH